MSSIARFCTSLMFSMCILLCQSTVNAAPLVSQLQPYGQGVIANGYARRDGESEVHYTETYLDDPMSNTIRAVYWSGNREPISYKQLDFGENHYTPKNFEAIDYRRKKGFRITVENNVANIKNLKITEDGSESVIQSRDVAINSRTVIDAAFHRFVLANWDQLARGEKYKVNFLRIDKAKLVPLEIKKVRCDTADATCFKISFDNFLLKNMVPNISMQYDAQKRLIRYTGIGPVAKLNGKPLPVDIVYEYF